MNYPLPEKLRGIEPPVEFIDEVAGIYFRSIVLRHGEVVPQHVHDYDHATLVCSGIARLWVDGEWSADIHEGTAVKIEANRGHLFQALKDGTRLTCVHSAQSAEAIKEGGL